MWSKQEKEEWGTPYRGDMSKEGEKKAEETRRIQVLYGGNSKRQAPQESGEGKYMRREVRKIVWMTPKATSLNAPFSSSLKEPSLRIRFFKKNPE